VYGALAGSNAVSGTTLTASTTPAAAANVLTVIGSSTTGNVVQFSNTAGGTFIMTNAGRVGIGTASPGVALQVNGTGEIFRITDGTRSIYAGCDVNEPFFGASTNNALRITTNSTERMRITAAGLVGIGLTTPLHPLHVSGTTLTASQVVKYINYAGVPNWTAVTQQTALSIYGSGSIGTSDAFCLFSDERIKVEEQPSKTYLDLVNAVDVKTFTYIDKIQYGPQKRVGFFAQEVEKVLPGAVTHLKDFIPNIFKKCEATDKKVVISGHSLCPEQVIRVMHHESIDECKVVSVDGDTIEVDKVIDGNVFIYGTQVDDFRVLNYDYISSVAFGGLKELHALVKTQQKTIEALESRLAALEARA
jgi:hypothetical protein